MIKSISSSKNSSEMLPNLFVVKIIIKQRPKNIIFSIICKEIDYCFLRDGLSVKQLILCGSYKRNRKDASPFVYRSEAPHILLHSTINSG